MADAMDAELALRFILLFGGRPYGNLTTHKVRISTKDDVDDLRDAIVMKYKPRLDNLDVGRLAIYFTDLTAQQSKDLYETLAAGQSIDLSQWTMGKMPPLDLLSDTFHEQPDRRAIHILVDCTDAGKQRESDGHST
jgi:hypothetical protein